MSYFLLSAIVILCILPTGLSAEECIQTVLAKRDTVYVAEGGRKSLSCDIQHCGDTWTGTWIWTHSGTTTNKTLILNSKRHSVTNMTLSENKTRLILNFLSANQSDEGYYGCAVRWGQGSTAQGHYIYVNITAAVPTKRIFFHRFLVCACACLCPFAILGLVCCLRSGVKPQPLPRTQCIYQRGYGDQTQSPPKPPPRRPVPNKRRAPPRSTQKTEVVYADISQDALCQQRAIKEPTHSTVYSSVKFS